MQSVGLPESSKRRIEGNAMLDRQSEGAVRRARTDGAVSAWLTSNGCFNNYTVLFNGHDTASNLGCQNISIQDGRSPDLAVTNVGGVVLCGVR